MIVRILNYGFILIFALAAAVQYNDKDPLFWIFVYGVACMLSLLFVFNKVHKLVLISLAVICGIWAMFIIPELTLNGFKHMFGDLEMMQSGVEETREFLGLLIICGWMITLSMSTQK